MSDLKKEQVETLMLLYASNSQMLALLLKLSCKTQLTKARFSSLTIMRSKRSEPCKWLNSKISLTGKSIDNNKPEDSNGMN